MKGKKKETERGRAGKSLLHLPWRYRGETALILTGILLTGIFSLLVSYYFSPIGEASAADSRPQAVEGKIPGGFQGVLAGVESMKEYCRAGRSQSLRTPSEEPLVGPRVVDHSCAERAVMAGYLEKAGSLGADALRTIQSNQLPYDEYMTLLAIVEAEATGGDVESKKMVANVVLNRVRDERFPDTISEVVWQRVNGSAQFSPTADGRMGNTQITEGTIEAVNAALRGDDNAQGALFFVARDTASSENVAWFDSSLVRLFDYGGHEYYTFRE